MPYMAVGSRQILFNDTQAPAMATPVEQQNNTRPADQVASSQSSNPLPATAEHIGQNIDITA